MLAKAGSDYSCKCHSINHNLVAVTRTVHVYSFIVRKEVSMTGQHLVFVCYRASQNTCAHITQAYGINCMNK